MWKQYLTRKRGSKPGPAYSRVYCSKLKFCTTHARVEEGCFSFLDKAKMSPGGKEQFKVVL